MICLRRSVSFLGTSDQTQEVVWLKKKERQSMNGLTMMILAVVVLGSAYLIYGEVSCKGNGASIPDSETPAYEMEDGVDYVPADTNVVFGHQFASIAGRGADQLDRFRRRCSNGFLLCSGFCWAACSSAQYRIFASMYASVKRNRGRSIGYIIGLYIGKLGKRLFSAVPGCSPFWW